MKKRGRKKMIIWSAIALLAVGLAGWRLWPRSFDSFLDRPSREAVKADCHLTFFDFEDGYAVNRSYELEAEDERESRNLLNILRRGQYQASFADLLPWDSYPTSTGNGKMVHVFFLYPGEQEAGLVDLYGGFTSGNYVSVNGRRANLIGDEVFNELVDYIREKGTEPPPTPSDVAGRLARGIDKSLTQNAMYIYGD